MTDVQLRLTNAKHQIEWAVCLLARLDQHLEIPWTRQDAGPDGEPDPPNMEELDCRVIQPGSGPVTIGTVKELSLAAIRDINALLPRPGA